MAQAATQYFDFEEEAEAQEDNLLPYSPRHLETDFSHEVSHLERMVAHSLKQLQTSCAQMQRVEEELRGFLAAYHGQVGGFFEQLEALKSQIADYDRRIRKARPASAAMHGDDEAAEQVRAHLLAMPLDLTQDDWEGEMKTIYHTLVKLYHPDVAQRGTCSTRVLQLINAAYEKRNLWAMREMEHSLVEHALADSDTPTGKLARLRERYDAISRAVTAAVERSNRLQRSEAWQLKQRSEHNAYLVEVVIHRVKQQIEDARRLLAQKRIEYQAAIL